MRYSKQRELVLRTVEQLCDHPTAEEIFDKAAPECPGLSLGTVSRSFARICSVRSARSKIRVMQSVRCAPASRQAEKTERKTRSTVKTSRKAESLHPKL